MTAPSDQSATERRKIDSDIDAPTTKAGDGKVAVSTYTRDILECDLPPVVLDELLKDRTTGKNIIWATDDYATRGPGFTFRDEIAAAAVSRRADPIIRPRVDKPKDVQRDRAKKRAEIFTPAWLCCDMIDLADCAWLDRKTSPFSAKKPRAKTLVSNWNLSKPVHFPKKPKTRTWEAYVAEGRLEITCGEGPFLASRYDAATGEIIPVPARIGILDRKLRVVSERCRDEADWFAWAKRAVQGTYGFEWQGDNLLLARENVLATVAEFHDFVFLHEERTDFSALPSDYLVELARIVSWNLWQMDGLKGVVPLPCPERVEADLFGKETCIPCPGCKDKRHPLENILLHTGAYCNIVRDWTSDPPEVCRFVDVLDYFGKEP